MKISTQEMRRIRDELIDHLATESPVPRKDVAVIIRMLDDMIVKTLEEAHEQGYTAQAQAAE